MWHGRVRVCRRTQSRLVRCVQGVPGNDHHAISAFRNLRTEASDVARRGAARRLRRALSPLIRKGSGRKRKEIDKQAKLRAFHSLFDAMDLYTPYESASGTRTHVRVSAGTRGVCVRRRNEEAPVWRGVGEDDGEGGEGRGRGRAGGRGKGGETPPESLSGRRI